MYQHVGTCGARALCPCAVQLLLVTSLYYVWPACVQVVWLVAAGMTVMGLALVATLHWSGHDPSSHGYSPVEKQDDLAPADYAKESTAGTRKRQPSLPAGSDHV